VFLDVFGDSGVAATMIVVGNGGFMSQSLLVEVEVDAVVG